jgi:hypothetical protein
MSRIMTTHSQPSCRVSREALAAWIGEAIVEIVHGEGGLVQLAREVEVGDPNHRLLDESCEAVGLALWEAPSSSDMAVAARLSGSLTALFDLASHFDLELPLEAQVLKEWCETINPF